MSNDDETAGSSSVAVIGVAGRFPGAGDVEQLWANLRAGVESIRFFSEEELLAAGESAQLLREPGYVRAQAQLEGIDRFDAAFFGISALDAAVFDPQHRVFLECAWAAFEDAGYVGERIAGPVGVFASSGFNEYLIKNVLANAEVKASMGEWLIRHTGNDPNFLATRVSYELNLRGPSLSVQTACSSSLVALHAACQSLLSGECDAALAGGCTITPELARGYLYKEGEILSPDGHCRAFAADSKGTIFSSACGAVVLKRLDDALADGDRIHAVIRGSAINNDGRDKVGYLAPSVSGQARVVTEALAVSGVDARDVTYVEAHGTGTPVGDPIEIAGLTQAFRETTGDTQFCAIGSVKTNVGHAGEAAGIVGLLKTVLCLQHRELPPSLNCATPNPHAGFEASPFFVNTALRKWDVAPGKKRIAGVTGLGAGGTNAHVIIEEAPEPQPSGPSRAAQLITVSAKTPAALEQAARQLAAHLKAHPEVNLADVAFTQLSGRKAFRHRRAVSAASAAQAIAGLEAPGGGQAVDGASLALMFPGGGAQYAEMGRGLYDAEPAYREAFDACARFIQPKLGADLRALKGLERPSVALPALFATEYALAKLLLSWGLTPAAMIGHSAGEYTAACLAGVLSMEDALSLVALRGRLFEKLPPGAMLSVSLPEERVLARLPVGLGLAAVNGPSACVVSGPAAQIEALEAELKADQVDCSRVHIDVAAHSAMLEPILGEFRAFCRGVNFQPPKLPWVSNLTGTWITAADATDPEYWVRHLREPVRFADGLKTLFAGGQRIALEVGPGRALSSFARLGEAKPLAAVCAMRHPKEEGSDLQVLIGALGKLWVAGLELDAPKLHAGERRQRVCLPTYPFERQRYWIEPSKVAAAPTVEATLRKRPDVGDWFATPNWRRTAPRVADRTRETWLVIEDRRQPLSERVVSRLKGNREPVVRVSHAEHFLERANGSFTLDFNKKRDWEGLIATLEQRGALPTRVVHATAIDAPARMSPTEWISADAFDMFAAVSRDCAALLFLVQALGAQGTAARVAVVTSGVHSVLGGRHEGPDLSAALQEVFGGRGRSALVPERAMLHGALRVVPREYPQLEAVAIDVDLPSTDSPEQARLVDRLLHELHCPAKEDVIALRGGERWVRAIDPVRLEPSVDPQPWVRSGGVYVITGGLGGLGLEVAEHLAKIAKAKLVLIGRTPLPPESAWNDWISTHAADEPTRVKVERIRKLKALGAEVMVACANVGDRIGMGMLVSRVKARFGPIHGVFHCAGVLRDGLIAMRGPQAPLEVLHSKVKGTLVLEEVLAGEPLELFVIFSSVSALLGLPGQADYSAANAFCDAFAHKKAAEGKVRTLSIDWNGWQHVGMAAAAVKAEPKRAGASGRLLEEVHPEAESLRLATVFSRARHWVLDEHVVHGREAVMPGTGFAQLAAEAIEQGGRAPGSSQAIVLEDLFFLEPFALADKEERKLQVKLDRRSAELTIFSEAESAPHATARAKWVEAPPPVNHDLAAIRARCNARSERYAGYLPQPFMDFGPRWGCLRGIDFGAGEALAHVELPEAYAAETRTHRLHPAVLDLATGCAQALIPGVDPSQTFYVPFTYQRLLSRRALPSRVVSHIRLRESSADLAVFDVSICDEAGEEVAKVEGYTMRRIGDGARLAMAPRRVSQPSRGETALEATLREGILPAEGIDALDRMLATDVAPQLVASSIDLNAWRREVDAAAKAERAAEVIAAGPTFERPSLSTSFVAPASALEQEVAALFSELLGVQKVGLHDDFFELGGQSLIAVRLFGRIRKRWGVELPLSTLFAAPTVAGCAAVLAPHVAQAAPVLTLPSPSSRPEPAKPVFKSLVTIQRGGDRTPFFCVHGAGGNVLNFRDLSKLMDRAQPFFGLQARGIDGASPLHRSIEEMAEAYLEEIRQVQPHGPYLLGGYSGGGVVAFEMAQRLTAEGEQVDLLAMIDTFHPQMPIRRMSLKRRLERLADGGLDYVRSGVEKRLGARRVHQLEAQLRAHVERGEPVPPELRELHLMRNFERAAAAYRPRPYAGSATFFRAEQVAYIYLDAGPSYGWSEVIRGGLEMIRVPGDHTNLLLEPNAQVVAKALCKALDEAEQKLQTQHRPVSA